MEILGHKDPRMTLRYQHLTPAHLHKAMTALDSKNQEAPAPTPGVGAGWLGTI